jgi:hypothetical protein
VRLGDFFDLPDDHAPTRDVEDDHNTAGSNTSREHADHTPVNLRTNDGGMARKSGSKEPLPVDSYPPLAAPKKDAQSTARGLWANASPAIRAAPPKPVPPRSAKGKGKQKQDETKQSSGEQFAELEKKSEQRTQLPQLGNTGSKATKGITGKELWAALPRDRDARASKEVQRQNESSAIRETSDVQRGPKKKGKKNKWERMVL